MLQIIEQTQLQVHMDVEQKAKAEEEDVVVEVVMARVLLMFKLCQETAKDCVEHAARSFLECFSLFPISFFLDACRCTHTYMYVYLRIHKLTRVCRYICTRILIYMDVRIHANAYVFTCACTDVCE